MVFLKMNQKQQQTLSDRGDFMAHRRLTSACISCLTKGHIEKHPADISEEQQIAYKQKVLQILGTATEDESAPMIKKIG